MYQPHSTGFSHYGYGSRFSHSLAVVSQLYLLVCCCCRQFKLSSSCVCRQKREITKHGLLFLLICLMSTAQNYFRMELGTLIAKRAYGKSHYVYNCADGLLKGQDIVTDAGAQRRVG